MIKCKGYYSDPIEEIDYKHYEDMGMKPHEPVEPEMIETDCWISGDDIKAVFDTKDGKLIVYYSSGWDVLIKKEKKVLDQLI